jgi:hypothetical protein
MAKTKKSQPPVVDQQDEGEDYQPLASGIDEGKSYSLYYDSRAALTSTLGNPSDIPTHLKTARQVNPRVQARKERDPWGIIIYSFSSSFFVLKLKLQY